MSLLRTVRLVTSSRRDQTTETRVTEDSLLTRPIHEVHERNQAEGPARTTTTPEPVAIGLARSTHTTPGMRSHSHAFVSAIVGLGLAIAAPPDVSPLLVIIGAVALGVGIDLDHFLIARSTRGDWTNLRRCIRNPRIVFLDQDAIFDHGDVRHDERLLSHVVIGGMLVGTLLTVHAYWALVAGVTLYAHLACDLVADVRTHRTAVDQTTPRTDDPG